MRNTFFVLERITAISRLDGHPADPLSFELCPIGGAQKNFVLILDTAFLIVIIFNINTLYFITQETVEGGGGKHEKN
ncbi:hypothetical protein GT50_17970 [Geobacillus stearothermophilus 10]|nr:hypothetical protein GT50_17970 [Geobacillus stearothermophilus 10]